MEVIIASTLTLNWRPLEPYVTLNPQFTPAASPDSTPLLVPLTHHMNTTMPQKNGAAPAFWEETAFFMTLEE
ncbi:MAG TPA: hypothetical protein VNT26_21440 [Candidatus Sulfotelmatobacter sp.]|nr:hypothetical protein [Candidatus Sulfotelmatobacter sp.]